MANVIKHKRGSGSDPGASDLVVGEVAIRTDVGKLFTKMDNGSVAEIAGGGSDIAINTLSSSSGTGGGSATFNGSAYRFTLSAPPSVSAQQLLVSINGVIQKPVAGTGQPSEGFSVDGTDIILGDAPATGSDFFILTFKSLGVSEPADNSVTSAKIVDGAIVNVDINASAAIAGTKISPDFGSQNISTTGTLSLAAVAGTNTNAALNVLFQTSAGVIDGGSGLTYNPGGDSLSVNGNFINANTFRGDGNLGRLTCDNHSSTTTVDVSSTVNILTNDNATDAFSVKQGSNEYITVDTNNSSELITLGNTTTNPKTAILGGNVGIGTTSPSTRLTVTDTGPAIVDIHHSDGGTGDEARIILGALSANPPSNRGAGIAAVNNGAGHDLTIKTSPSHSLGPTEKVRVTSGGLVGIGNTSPSAAIEVTFDSGGSAPSSGTAPEGVAISYGTADGKNGGIWFSPGFGDDQGISGISSSRTSGYQTDLRFYTNNTNSARAFTERMRIGSDGRVMINTTSDTFDGVTGNLNIANDNFNNHTVINLSRNTTADRSQIRFSNPNGNVGSISTSGSATSYNTSSDYRLKENVTAISDGITRLKTLKPYRFNFKADATTTVDGFFAHEVTAVPEAITGTKDEVDENGDPVYQCIDQSKLVPLLVAALQEAIGRIEVLEAK